MSSLSFLIEGNKIRGMKEERDESFAAGEFKTIFIQAENFI